jgi:hypothetical protein
VISPPSLNVVEKYCPGCKQVLPSEAFYKLIKAKRPRFSGYCKNCSKQRAKNKSKEKCRQSALKHNYGLTIEEYNNLLAQQNGKCAICGSQKPYGNGNHFAIDHNHQTGVVRALLCQKCNHSLGLVKESSKYLNKAAEYLEYWDSKHNDV